MDLMATTEILGNVGEFVGAIGVVVTLGYLALQIRQNTKTLRSSIYTSWVETAATTHQMITANASVYAEILTSTAQKVSELSPEAQIAVETWCTHTLNVFEASFLHHMEGAIDSTTFDAKHRNMVGFFQMKFTREMWERLSERIYDRRFIEYVNDHVLGKQTFP